MSGISDPLVQFFMGESNSKDILIQNQQKLIHNLQLDNLRLRTEYQELYRFYEQSLERCTRSYRTNRALRDHVFEIERRLALFTGRLEGFDVTVIDDDTDTDTDSDEQELL
jgi:hypothetical protein